MDALYHVCENFNILTFIGKFYGLKVSHRGRDQSFTELFQLLKKYCLQVIRPQITYTMQRRL